MSTSSDILRFCFSAYGDSILCKINTLREEQRFCDITLLLGDQHGATVQPLHFHAHRAVLAASSDFLRDQFLLHEGRAELSVGIVSSVEVGRRLLLSCYTGCLEVPLRELVSYLTAASALQMSQVVEKCAQAVSQYLSPALAFFKLERCSEEKEIQQPENDCWPVTSFNNQEEKDAAEPSTSIQEASTGEGGTAVIQTKKSNLNQGAEVDGHRLREVRNDRRVVIAKIEEDAAGCLDTLESEEGEAIQPGHTDNQVCHVTGALQCKQHPPTGHISPTTTRRSQREELAYSSLNQDEEAQEEQKEEEEMFLLAAQLQECGELTNSELFRLSGAKSLRPGDELAEGSDSILIQRPYLCRRCDRVFQHLQSYVGHLKEHRQHLCLVCGRGFSQRSNLTRHVHVHAGVKPFRCPLCHRMFSQKATLQDHLGLHTGDNKPHKCKSCAVLFAHKPGLRRHLKDVHGKRSLENMLEEAEH